MKAASSSTGVLQGVRVPTCQWKAQVATCSGVGRARTCAHLRAGPAGRPETFVLAIRVRRPPKAHRSS